MKSPSGVVEAHSIISVHNGESAFSKCESSPRLIQIVDGVWVYKAQATP